MNLKYWVCYKKVGIGHHYQRIKNRRRSGHFQFHRHQLLPDKVDRLFFSEIGSYSDTSILV